MINTETKIGHVPFFKLSLDESLKSVFVDNQLELSKGKYIGPYNHQTQGNNWHTELYPQSDPKFHDLQDVKYALYLEQPDSATAETIVFFMKCIRDSGIEVDCWLTNNQTNSVKNIDFNDSRTVGKPELYALVDIDVLKKMCVSYFDIIVKSTTENEDYLQLFLAINYARVAFSVSKDQRLRIPLLGTALECLFSTKRYEVSHRVGENIAWFLESEFSEKRIEKYDLFQEFYDTRSEIIHGGYSPKALDKQIKAYQFALDILVQSFKKILLSEDLIEKWKSKTSKERFFKDLILN